MEWRRIESVEGEYYVSDQGDVKNSKGLILRTVLCRKGYKKISAWYRGKATHKRVHVAVLEAFEGLKPSSNMVCRHLNGDRLDNRATNLRWGTYKENSADMVLHGTSKRRFEAYDVRMIIGLSIMKISDRTIGAHFKVSAPQIYAIVTGRTYQDVTGRNFRAKKVMCAVGLAA